MKILKRIFLYLNILFAIFLLLSYLATNISPSTFWPLSFMGLLYPYLIWTNMLFLLFWLIVRPKLSLLSVIVVVIGIGHFLNYFQISKGDMEPINNETEIELKILSYNVKYFPKGDNASNKGDFVDFLKNEDRDLICMQEAISTSKSEFGAESIAKALKHENSKYFYAKAKGVYAGPITFSKLPIKGIVEYHFDNSQNMILQTDIEINSNLLIRVFNCHLESYKISENKYSVINSINVDEEQQQLKELDDIGARLKHAFIARSAQIDTLTRKIKDSPYPVLVCGDFNDTPVSYSYTRVRELLNDAFVEKGEGVMSTYIGKLPSFRIDYIFFDPQWRCIDYNCPNVVFSDHYPIKSTLAIPIKIESK